MLLQVVQVRDYDLTVPRWWELLEWPGYLQRVFVCIPVITIPLLIGSLRTTSVMAMVVDARAFGSHTERNTLKEHQTNLAVRIALCSLVVLTILLVILHISNRAV